MNNKEVMRELHLFYDWLRIFARPSTVKSFGKLIDIIEAKLKTRTQEKNADKI